jgi:hypothetical protein
MRKLRLLIALIAGLALAVALAVAHPGIAQAYAQYNEWTTPDGLCMGVQGGNMTPGTAIISWTCDDSNNQFWGMDFNSGAPNYFLLRNLANPSECLSVLNKATNIGAPLVIWGCKKVSDNQDQRWQRADAYSVPIFNFNSSLQILPSGGKGSVIEQWDDRIAYPWVGMDFVLA